MPIVFFLAMDDEVMQTLRTSKKLREEPHKMLSDDKDMSNCFGFDVSLKIS